MLRSIEIRTLKGEAEKTLNRQGPVQLNKLTDVQDIVRLPIKRCEWIQHMNRMKTRCLHRIITDCISVGVDPKAAVSGNLMNENVGDGLTYV